MNRTENEGRQAADTQVAPKFSAATLATAIGAVAPTTQQAAVIEAPLEPTLVIAGAGSGKTETMAMRVVWLIANGLVEPQEVLGLTFTRKAAASLASRIDRMLGALDRTRTARGEQQEGTQTALVLNLDAPKVSTYNSFASSLVSEYGLAIGREPDSDVIGEAAAWQLARSVVVEAGDGRLVPLDKSVDSIAGTVVDLARAIADNVADVEQIRAYALEFLKIRDLPYTSGRKKAEPYASVVSATAKVAALDPLLDLVVGYRDAKRRRGLVEFADQVALALEVCERFPTAIELTRSRYRVVLLDEYQDTSVIQSRLLSQLFRNHPVTAVGDPNQSIYGWRGASATNMTRFGYDFAADDPNSSKQGSRGALEPYALSTSWRNASSILDAANLIAKPLREASKVPVLELSARPEAPVGSIGVRFEQTLDEEVAAVAGWCKAKVAERTQAGDPLEVAMLFRSRKHMQRFADQLAELDVPHQVVGLGGLLESPEIVDLICALRVLVNPDAGNDLIRLLVGPRWRIGVRDLAELESLAVWLHDRDPAQQLLDQQLRDRRRASASRDDGRSIVDALDWLTDAKPGHTRTSGFSEQGLARLVEAGNLMRRLRQRLALPLPEIVHVIEQELRLDLETLSNDRATTGILNLRAFRDELDSFMRIDDQGKPESFLAWLDRAKDLERIAIPEVEQRPGVVQLLTVHAAKGLEWDAVCVPRLVAEEFPAKPKEGNGWLQIGELPAVFRGDAAEIPQLSWQQATTQAEVDQAIKTYAAALASRHHEEERRLAYVATTRAKGELLLTGSFWAGGQRPRQPSTYLAELAEARIIGDLAEESLGQRPEDDGVRSLVWPPDPLGTRRNRVEAAAAAFFAANADPASTADIGTAQAGSQSSVRMPWADDLDLLLRERELAMSVPPAAVPERIAASGLKDWIGDPAAQLQSVRRPMPQKPFRATRIGTRFHAWVEARYGMASTTDLLDAAPDEIDASTDNNEVAAELNSPHQDDAQLQRLQDAFERSEWAGLAPFAVEVEINLPFADHTIVCKLDAVYRRAERWQVVDWKTGRAPRDTAELQQRQLQLAVYRLAWARHQNVALDEVDVALFYVAEERTIVPDRVLSEDELLRLWGAAMQSLES